MCASASVPKRHTYICSRTPPPPPPPPLLCGAVIVAVVAGAVVGLVVVVVVVVVLVVHDFNHIVAGSSSYPFPLWCGVVWFGFGRSSSSTTTTSIGWS